MIKRNISCWSCGYTCWLAVIAVLLRNIWLTARQLKWHTNLLHSQSGQPFLSFLRPLPHLINFRHSLLGQTAGSVGGGNRVITVNDDTLHRHLWVYMLEALLSLSRVDSKWGTPIDEILAQLTASTDFAAWFISVEAVRTETSAVNWSACYRFCNDRWMRWELGTD